MNQVNGLDWVEDSYIMVICVPTHYTQRREYI